jgi:uncharacterized membrane protein
MLAVLLALVAAILGEAWGALSAALLGLILGRLWTRVDAMRDRLDALSIDYQALKEKHGDLERELLALKSAGSTATSAKAEAPEPPTVTAVPETPPQPAWTLPRAAIPTPEPASASAALTPADDNAAPRQPHAGAPVPMARPVSSEPGGIESLSAASQWLVEFFTTGNVVAKVGVVIVFFGVAFLLRYAAERGMLPIEYRLMGTALGAVLLLTIGWRLRHSRRDYAIVLQGGAVGVLYLTIFAAFRLYALLPATLTFALLLMVVAFSAVLAVAQGTMSLAALGTSGGFLAPILASTGAGSHVALFSYYAVLNAGIVGIAWFRAWRFLNWLAFVFTFGIGFVWGQQYYQPAFFPTTEPFLVLFFLMFLAVAVLFAHRQPPQLRGYIDGSLVFGTPAIAFAMQSVLVRAIPLGRAYSAVALAALYLVLARVLMRRDEAIRALAEAFLALAVVFLILAVPLAFDGHATAAAWALEGAGLIWIGIRQNRRLARLVGAALLVGAGAAFGAMASPSAAPLAVLNTRFLGGVAIAAGGVIAGLLLSRARHLLAEWERPIEWALLAWGLAWWFGALTVEIVDHVPTRFVPSALLLEVAASGCAIALLARRWNWPTMMLATIPIGPFSWLLALAVAALQGREGPLPDLGWLAWPTVLASNYLVLFWFELVWPTLVVKAWHAITGWLLMFLTTWTVAVAVDQALPDAQTWSMAVWCVIPVLFVLALRGPAGSLAWPAQRFPVLYQAVVPMAPVVASLLWVVTVSVQAGDPDPLPYVPLLNPLELTQAFALIVAFAWWRDAAAALAMDGETRRLAGAFPAGLAFLALNAMVGRVVHFYLGVPFTFEDLTRSAIFQAGISILWGTVAAVLMTVARLRRARAIWIVGAGVLAVLILKLFLVDLGNVGGVARIVSFLATGILILLIGYFAPAPPRAPRPEPEQTS